MADEQNSVEPGAPSAETQAPEAAPEATAAAEVAAAPAQQGAPLSDPDQIHDACVNLIGRLATEERNQIMQRLRNLFGG